MTEETKENKNKKKAKSDGEKKPLNIGGLIVKLLVALMVALLLAMIGLGVYIFVFPDDWPKPFYVSMGPPAAEAAGHAESEPTPKPAGHAEAAPELPAALPLPGEGLMFDTGTKIVNLADPGGRRYLKISIVLEYAPHDAAFYTLVGEERTAEVTLFAEEMNSKKPIIDDLFNTLLSSKTYDEIYTVEGKELLRMDIVARVNALLPTEHLMYVYFTEFVVQ
ncbi:MAG: flagellar basal body-associated FliL family protein [Chloroflexi bacterium]|nr:flagellar basal body-associated FliL family protein [Chloroflexota bacterium]